MGFREIEHTADIGIEIWGSGYEELFRAAADGFYHLACGDLNPANPGDFSLNIAADSAEELLVSFLSELNYLLISAKKVLQSVNHIQIGNRKQQFTLHLQGLAGFLSDADFDRLTEIKSVTWHQLKVTRHEGLLRTKIFFDI